MAHRMRRALTALLVLATAFSGCLAADGGNDAPADPAAASRAPFVDPLGEDHDHSDPSLHDKAMGFELLHHHPLAAGNDAVAGAHAVDVRNGWLFVATTGDVVGADAGVWIFNVSNPEAPELTGRVRFPGAMGGDRSMEASPDADFVVVGTEALDCSGNVNPFAPGLYLIDARDKASPLIVDYFPAEGVHSVAVHRINGEDYVFSVIFPGAGIYKIDKTGPKPRLVEAGRVDVGHDSFLMDDPLLGKTLLYAANGAGPLDVYDVSDPSTPQLIGKWNIPDRGEDEYYVHTAAAEITPDGRRIVIVSSEDWLDYPSPLWVLDATDFEAIEQIGYWTNPGGHPATDGLYSLHNPRLVDGTLYLAHYHAGVWALDLADPTAPAVKGYYMPHEPVAMGQGPRGQAVVTTTGVCPYLAFDAAPYTMDVEYANGVLYAADVATGLYTLRPPA